MSEKEEQKEAVAPEGWENTVKKMKKHPEIDNPWALAWHMRNKGDTPGGKEAAEFAQAVIKQVGASAAAEFQAAVSSERVALRFAKTFPSTEALNKYLQKHPNANARDHKVVRPQDRSDEDKRMDDLKSRSRHNKRQEKKKQDAEAKAKEDKDKESEDREKKFMDNLKSLARHNKRQEKKAK